MPTPLTVRDAARRLRRNPELVRRWLRDGRLAGELVAGAVWLIQVRDVDRLLQNEPQRRGGVPKRAPSRFPRAGLEWVDGFCKRCRRSARVARIPRAHDRRRFCEPCLREMGRLSSA